MFISRQTYEDLLDDRAELRAVATQNAVLTTHVEWLQARITELNYERAGLLKQYMNIDVPVATFEKPQHFPDPNEPLSFEDIGDEKAAQLGIGWTKDGHLEYAK